MDFYFLLRELKNLLHGMFKAPLFYKIYDDLYQHKNYQVEVKNTYEILKRHSTHKLTSLLELGCGTGNHTKEFAHYFRQITAVDIDRDMLSIAKRKKIPETKTTVAFTTTPVTHLPLTQFSAAVALFNVINYIENWATLTDFLAAIRKRLKPKSIFMFDVWNGIAALLDPPNIKQIKYKQNDQQIEARIKPTLDRFAQTVTLEYQLAVKSETIVKDIFVIKHRLWTPFELTETLTSVGFKIMSLSPVWQIEKPASETDYKIMFVCQS